MEDVGGMAVKTGPIGQTRAGLRRRLFRLHQSVGLAIAAALLIVAATGVVLVFRAQFREERPVAPTVAAPLGLEALLARATEEAGGEDISDITLPTEEGAPYVFFVDDDPETVIYMAADGAVLARRVTANGPMRLLFRLHTGELLGWPGQAIALAAGVGSLALVASGLGMVWSRRRRRG